MDNSALDNLWAEYASLQERADHLSRVGHAAWSIEDQLNTFLESLAEGSLPVDDEAREKRLKNLLINRQRKHRHRLKLLQEHAVTVPTSSPSEPIIHKLIEDEMLVQVRASTTTQEWRILISLALDHDYVTVAQSEGISVTSLKTKVSRCRQRLRVCLAA